MANTRASKKAVTTQNSTFENESEKLMGIETIGDIKRVKLTDGRIAEVRKLKGKDVIRTRKMMSVLKDQEDIDFETLNMTVATTIDGAELPYEDYLEMPQVDFALITAMHSSINF